MNDLIEIQAELRRIMMDVVVDGDTLTQLDNLDDLIAWKIGKLKDAEKEVKSVVEDITLTNEHDTTTVTLEWDVDQLSINVNIPEVTSESDSCDLYFEEVNSNFDLNLKQATELRDLLNANIK